MVHSTKLDEKKSDQKAKMKNKKYLIFKGIGLALLSGVCFSSTAVIVKMVSNLQPEQLAVYRFLSIFVFSLPEAVKSGQNLMGPREYRLLLILRGLLGAANVTLSFFAFRYLPLGDASVILFSVPVFVTIAARLFLKEPCGLFQCTAVLLTVTGIILITKLPLRLLGDENVYTNSSILGFSAAAGSLFFNTCRYIVMRKVKTVHHSIVVFTSGWVAVLETLSVAAIFETFQWHNCGIQKFYIILLGLFSYLGQTLLTIALQCEQAGAVSTMRSAVDIALGFLWQIIIFHEIPDAFSISGAILVGISAIVLALGKWLSSLSHEPSHFIKLKRLTR